MSTSVASYAYHTKIVAVEPKVSKVTPDEDLQMVSVPETVTKRESCVGLALMFSSVEKDNMVVVGRSVKQINRNTLCVPALSR